MAGDRFLPGRARLGRWLDEVRGSEHQLTLLLSLLVGALVGLTIVAFILVTSLLGARLFPADAPAWGRVLVPTLGALVSGWLLFRYFPLARGSGIPQTKAAIFVGDGVITLPTVLGKFVCCSLSLASGIALGREGPSVHVGAGVASVVGRRAGLDSERVKALMPLGGSAALAAAFNTPIAGVLFALEEIVGDLHAPILGAAVLSSATAWIILHAFLGDEPLFHVAGYQLVHPSELAIYAVLGVVGGFVSVAFVKLLLAIRARFLRWRGRWSWLAPATGGLTVGIFGYFVPEALGIGYDYIERTLNGEVVLRAVLLLGVLKIVATAVCYGSGNAGGVFGPSLFIGAMTGAAVGAVAHGLLPATTATPGAYAVVGMGTAFAGIVRTPLTSVIMIFELTRDYTIIVPLMISNLIAFYVSHRLQRVPIYEALAMQEGIHLPSGDERGAARTGTVSKVMRPVPAAVAIDCTVAEAASRVRELGLDVWPIVEARGLSGLVTGAALDDAEAAGLGPRPVGELATAAIPWPDGTRRQHLHPDHGLPAAIERMHASGLRSLPVVSRANVRELVGIARLPDLAAGLGTLPARAERPAPRIGLGSLDAAPLAMALGTFALALGGLAVVDTFLARAERTHHRTDARRSYEAGLRLEAEGRPADAVERFRSAAALVRSDRQYQTALARAALASGRVDLAERVLTGVLQRDHADGEANLLMARLNAYRGDSDDATAYYHRAVYGQWPSDTAAHRTAARLEVVGLLARRGPSPELLGEMLLLEQSTDDPAIARRLAALYLQAGAPDRALDAWRRIRREAPRDPAVLAGIGEAHLARHEYRAARGSFAAALRLSPDDARLRQRIALCEDVLALDPTARGLSGRARLARSEALLEIVRKRLAACAPALAAPQPAPTAAGVRADPDEAAERHLAEAERLWDARGRACQGSADDERLALIFSSIRR
jgi:CIC family chloride channel protein